MTSSDTHHPLGRSRLTGRRSKYLIITLWLVGIAVATLFGARLTEVQDNAALVALPGGAETTLAADRLKAAFPGSDALIAVAVYARDGGLTDADRAKVAGDRAAFSQYAAAASGGATADGRSTTDNVPPAQPSADGAALLLAFPLAGDSAQQEKAAGQIKKLLAADRPDGLLTGLTGSAGGFTDVLDAFSGLDTTLLLVTAGIVVVLLLLTYRSPVLWLIPLVAVAGANQVATAVVYLLARYADLPVDLQSRSILTVLMFGLGVDYALLLIARYREELRRHADRHAAMCEALRRAYPAIVASAATVTFGLMCLLAADMPATRGLGPVAAVGVASALAAMTTLLPALLLLGGRWLFWPFVPRYTPEAVRADPATTHGRWAQAAGLVGRRPRLAWAGSAAVLGLLILGTGNLSLGLPGAETFTTEVGSATGQRLIERHYPGGASSPVQIIAASSRADAVVAAARTVDGVAEVATAVVSADGRWARIDAVLTAEGYSHTATRTTARLRSAVHAVPRADALVGGEPAAVLDTGLATDRDNRVVMPLILAVVFCVLVVLLRALIAPLMLLASVILSYFAALGASGFILSGLGHPRLTIILPLEGFLFLVALGVDYTIFLMTRAREETSMLGHRGGVLHALTVTGGVITSAGLVLASTFAALAVLPMVSTLQMGIVVAVGVLLDTLVVRCLLVPALTLDLGPTVWWPGRGRSVRATRSAQIPSSRPDTWSLHFGAHHPESADRHGGHDPEQRRGGQPGPLPWVQRGVPQQRFQAGPEVQPPGGDLNPVVQSGDYGPDGGHHEEDHDRQR